MHQNYPTEIILSFIKNGVNVYKGIVYKNILIIEFLMKIIKKKARKLNSINETLLHYAAKKNSIEMGEILLSKKVSVNIKSI